MEKEYTTTSVWDRDTIYAPSVDVIDKFPEEKKKEKKPLRFSCEEIHFSLTLEKEKITTNWPTLITLIAIIILLTSLIVYLIIRRKNNSNQEGKNISNLTKEENQPTTSNQNCLN